jgi:hypothetical protein
LPDNGRNEENEENIHNVNKSWKISRGTRSRGKAHPRKATTEVQGESV